MLGDGFVERVGHRTRPCTTSSSDYLPTDNQPADLYHK
jgi:hypothetical protein